MRDISSSGRSNNLKCAEILIAESAPTAFDNLNFSSIPAAFLLSTGGEVRSTAEIVPLRSPNFLWNFPNLGRHLVFVKLAFCRPRILAMSRNKSLTLRFSTTPSTPCTYRETGNELHLTYVLNLKTSKQHLQEDGHQLSIDKIRDHKSTTIVSTGLSSARTTIL